MLRLLTRSRPSVRLIPRTRVATLYPAQALIIGRQPRSNDFHSTPQRKGFPLVPFCMTLLKSSTSLELARMAGRIAMSFMPIILFKNLKSSRRIKFAALHGIPTSEETKEQVMKQIRFRKFILYGLLLIPLSLFWGTIISSLEKTPLTGRWRLIILSPEEEEEIAKQLAGQGWYNAVQDILAQDGPPTFIVPSDWRYRWVDETLRRLEAAIPILSNEPRTPPQWTSIDPDTVPMPPPAEFPLRPRPRASEYLRRFRDYLCDHKKAILPVTPSHAIQGPPYSLLIVDKPEASNAFSYGFGPDGAGGVVVYSGFLDDVLSRSPIDIPDQSWLTWLLGGFISRPSLQRRTPTPEQTTELAILLAHELSHLVLAHHLESLSSSSVIIPGTISIFTDIVRVVLFPVTMLFGPFVNDALAQLGKVGSLELSKMGQQCTNISQEIEADIVSARLLAHAGFDAREAVKFWEVRSSTISERPERDRQTASTMMPVSETLVRRIMGSTHPVNEIRVGRLKEELARWETARHSAKPAQ